MKGVVSYLTAVAQNRQRGRAVDFLASVLWVLSLVYRAGVFGYRGLYRLGLLKVFRAPIPVISVGNLTAGGTGKTPFVVMLCRMLKEEGFRPMVLTRGFMGGQGGSSDEAAMLGELLGPIVFTGADRIRSFDLAYKSGLFDCVVLDDGFQQWRLARDFDIVLIDGQQPFGNGALIPRGILREPRGALRRADLLVLTRVDRVAGRLLDPLVALLRSLAPQALISRGEHRVCAAREAWSGDRINLNDLAGQGGAFCAIGDPESFQSTLRELGIELTVFVPFPDHYRLTPEDIRKIVWDCREKRLKNLFVTHKDVVKLSDARELFIDIRLVVIDVEFVLTYGKIDLITGIRRLRRD